MRHRAMAKLLALCGAIGLGGPGCAYNLEVAGQSKAASGELQVDLLARGFLLRGQEVSSGFGYYAYLVFLDGSEATRAEREAAIRAFAHLLEDVTEVSRLPVPKERLAVLYCPVKELAPAPEKLLEAYDYSFAQLLTVELARRGLKLPRLFLLGSATPIQPRSAVDPAGLRVVELRGDAQAIEGTVLRFRSSLLAPERPAPAGALLERVYSFFESVGGFVLSVGSVGGAAPAPKP